MNVCPSLFNTAAEGANAFRLLASAPSTTATQRRTCDVSRIPSQRSCDGFFAVFVRRRVLLNVGRCCQVMTVLGNANSRPPFPPQLYLLFIHLLPKFQSRPQSMPENVLTQNWQTVLGGWKKRRPVDDRGLDKWTPEKTPALAFCARGRDQRPFHAASRAAASSARLPSSAWHVGRLFIYRVGRARARSH